jgi:hypothetical protein
MYPNPANGFLTFATRDYLPVEHLKITNLNGQKIIDFEMKGYTVDVSRLRRGVYILQFVIGGNTYLDRLVVD